MIAALLPLIGTIVNALVARIPDPVELEREKARLEAELVAQANAAAAHSAAIRTTDSVPPAVKATSESSPAVNPAPEPEKSAPSAILPDEVRPQVRPEDFLPFFQVPGSATQPGDVTLVMPVPRSVPTPPALPPSSATYTQTQK